MSKQALQSSYVDHLIELKSQLNGSCYTKVDL